MAAWQKFTDNEEDIGKLCDIAMDGDRGIIEEFSGFEFELGETIAKGIVCVKFVFGRKKIISTKDPVWGLFSNLNFNL